MNGSIFNPSGAPPASTRRNEAPRVLDDPTDPVARHQETLDQLVEQLSQVYEETDLLFRLASHLNETPNARRLVEASGSEIRKTLAFGWIATWFDVDSVGTKELDDKPTIHGDYPAGGCCLAETSRRLIQRWNAKDDIYRIVPGTPTGDPVADSTGAEVFARPLLHDGKIIGTLIAGNKTGTDPGLKSGDMRFLTAASSLVSVFHTNAARFDEQRAMFLGTLRALTAAIDAKDRYTRGHSDRVALLSMQMARQIGLSEKEAERYHIAGLIHDIGKIGVPEAVLCKPGKLDDAEFEQIKRHPAIGYHILQGIPTMNDVLPGVLHHHEKWDGRGYPHKLVGNDIPLMARIIALADTFDAMSSTRSYRTALLREKVLNEIARCAGSQFDPELVPHFLKLDLSGFDQLLNSASQEPPIPEPLLPSTPAHG